MFENFKKLFRYKKVKETNTMNTTIDPNEKLSNNFKLQEFLKSQTASRKNIDNTPDSMALTNIRTLVEGLLQPLRSDVGHPLIVTSGYRSPELNSAIGGSDTSQHTKGEAVDIESTELTNIELAEKIKNEYDFDQLILEFYNPDEGPNSGWVHVSYKEHTNRKEILTAMKVNGKTQYFYGIKTEN